MQLDQVESQAQILSCLRHSEEDLACVSCLLESTVASYKTSKHRVFWLLLRQHRIYGHGGWVSL